MTFNFDLNDYQDSPYISQELVIADILITRSLVELEEGIIAEVIDRMLLASNHPDKFVEKLVKVANNKRQAVKLASVIIQTHGNNSNGIEELTEEFFDGEFDKFVA